jgi:hypothetical protein
MQVITYKEALKIANSVRDGSYTEKVVGIFFTLKDCDVCGPWLKDVVTPIEEKFSPDFIGYEVHVDENDIAFPPPATPTSYFFVPGKSCKQQINRVGPGPIDRATFDIQRMIKMKNEGISLYEAFYG